MFDYVWWRYEHVANQDTCQSIIESTLWDTSADATINMDEQLSVDEKVRRTTIAWQPYNSDLGVHLLQLGRHANTQAAWNFDLDWQENIQIAKYSEAGDHYDWHMDTTTADENGRQRKLSVVLLLSSPLDYDGGVLELRSGIGQFKKTESPIANQGDVLVFPSIIEHRVSPIIRGIRCSAVNWICGPSFR